jgi:hypothetical protein
MRAAVAKGEDSILIPTDRDHNPLPVGVLDFGEIPIGSDASQRLSDSLRLAQVAELCGCAGYWIAEHRMSNVAWTDPWAILASIGYATREIRIGTGGIIVTNYEIEEIVRNASQLVRRFGQRIDIGLSRGFSVGRSALDEAQVDDKMRLLTPRLKNVGAQVWINGNSERTSSLAVSIGAGWAASTFHGKLDYSRFASISIGRACPTGLAVDMQCNLTGDEVAFESVKPGPFTGPANAIAESLKQLSRAYNPKFIPIVDLDQRALPREKNLRAITMSLRTLLTE